MDRKNMIKYWKCRGWHGFCLAAYWKHIKYTFCESSISGHSDSQKASEFPGNVLCFFICKVYFIWVQLNCNRRFSCRGKLYTTICWCSHMTIKLYLKFNVLEYITDFGRELLMVFKIGMKTCKMQSMIIAIMKNLFQLNWFII